MMKALLALSLLASSPALAQTARDVRPPLQRIDITDDDVVRGELARKMDKSVDDL